MFYIIKSKLNGYALDIERAKAVEYQPVMMWSYHGKDNQIFYDDPATGTIRPKLNKNLCLTFNGEQLVLLGYQQGNKEQQWMRQGQTIRNRVDPTQVLDIYRKNKDKGAKVGSYQYKGGDNQHWDFVAVEGKMEGVASAYHQGQRYNFTLQLASGTTPCIKKILYKAEHIYDISADMLREARLPRVREELREFFIKNLFSGKVLDVQGEKTQPGAKLIVYEQHSDNQPNQLWYLDNLGFIRSSLSDLVPWNKTKGEQLSMAMPSTDTRGQWVIQGNKIVSKAGECMDIHNKEKGNSAKIISSDVNDQENQHWEIIHL